MNKKLISLLVAICLVIGLLPVVSIADDTVTSATVTLFGTEVTVDLNNATADIPAARYWVDGTEGQAPAVAAAAESWNYRFSIIDGVPTVTLKNATYTYAERCIFLAETYAGKFNVVYQGTNNMTVPNKSNAQFLHVGFDSKNKTSVSVNLIGEDVGTEKAVLNVTGGAKSDPLISVSGGTSVYRELNMIGGAVNLSKSKISNSHNNGVMQLSYCTLLVENSTLMATSNGYSNAAYATYAEIFAGGGTAGQNITIRNSDVTVISSCMIGLASAVRDSKTAATDYLTELIIEGDSNVLVNHTPAKSSKYDLSTKAFCGAVFASKVVMKGGTLEVKESSAENFALNNFKKDGTGVPTADILDMSQCEGTYEMYTAEGGAAVTEYTATNYFKMVVTLPCQHANTTDNEVVVNPATCGEPGSKTVTTTCNDCGETLNTKTETIPATGEHTYTDDADLECDECGYTRCFHTNATTKEEVNPATCVNPGSKTVTTTCDDCGETLSTKTETIPATGEHTVARTEVEVLEHATADKEGKKRVTEYCACGEMLGTKEEPIPIPVVDMEAAEVDTTKPTAPATPATNGTVKLWGTEITVDTDDTTADVPAAYYWTNGVAGELPVVAAATDNWNYSFSIIDGVPTVTLRNASYSGTESFLSASYEGNLRVAYEGTNNFTVPYTNGSKYFISFSKPSSKSGYGHLFLAGAEDAVLNVTGGDKSASMIGVSNKAYLTIYGGTINMEKAVGNGGTTALIGAAYAKTVIQDCTLNVKNLSNVNGKQPAVSVGGTQSLIVTNAKINIETNAHTGLCVGVFQSNGDGVLYVGSMTVNGSSKIKVVANTIGGNSKLYSGVGIYASSLNIKNGSLEVESTKKAVHLTTSGATPNLAEYTGQYKMFTAKYSADVTEYTETPYFRVACCTPPCLHTNTTTNEVVNPATCVNPGSKTVTTTCNDCGKTLSTNTEPIPATGLHIADRTEVEILEPATVDKEGKKRITVYCACGKVLSTTEDVIPIPVLEMNAPAVNTTKPTAPSTPAANGTVKLWGTEVTVDTDDATADIPAAYYWVNGAAGELPVAAADTDNWNYAFSIIDGVPTVTLRDVKYDGANTFLYAKYDGNLRVVYEGTNDIVVPYNGAEDENRYFIYYSAATNEVGKGKLFIEGAENAVLNVTGGDNISMLALSNKAYLTIYGGTINMEKTNAGGVQAVIGAPYCKTVIQDCTLNVRNTTNVDGKHPAVVVGYSSNGLTVTNAKINIETNAHSGLCVGVFQSNLNGILYPATMTVNGSSNVKIVTNTIGGNSKPYSGVGIYASKLIMLNGNLEVEGNTKAVHLTSSGATPELIDYAGVYKMFTAKHSADVTEYTETPYFRIAYTGESLNYKLKIHGTDYKVRVYNEPIYLINTTATGYFNKTKKIPVIDPTTGEPVLDSKGNPKTETVLDVSDTGIYKTLTKEGANEDNYNAKLVWHEGDNGPTLYLRDIVLDDYNDELGRWRYKNDTATSALAHTTITTDAKAPLHIVLTGADSTIECRFGIHYNNDLNIKSVGDAKLKMNNQSSNITSLDVSGYTLTVDANLDLYIRGLYNTPHSGGAIMSYGGDVIINGGNIVTDNGADGKGVYSLYARGEGANLIINGGNITGISYNGASHGNGTIQAYEKVIINGGVVNVTSKKAVGIYGRGGIEINGGEIKVMSPWYGITAGVKVDKKVQTAPVHINGGTLTVLAEHAFYTGSELYIGDGVMAYAGAGQRNAEVFDGTSAKLATKPWFFATDDESKFLDIEEEEDDDSILDIPTAPTTADGTGAPSDATGVPGAPDSTGATTPGGQNPDQDTPEDEIPEVEYWDSNIYIDYVEGDMDVIPDALIEIGLDSADAIWNALLEMMWNVDEYINRVSFFDAVPWFYNGEEWVFAEETDLPEDGYVTVVLPYPEGTDMDTEFTALHMFTTDTFGMTPGDVELLLPVNTEEGIVLELIGLSPVMLGWIDYDGEDEINPPTGDTEVAIYFTMLLFSVLGMATVVLLNKKRAV